MSIMKALKWFAEKNKVELVDVQKPQKLLDDHVLIRVIYCGVCGTDLHIMHKEFAAAEEAILGHEISGIVEKVGANVHHLEVGNKVSVNPNSNCQKCRFCLKGQVNYCVSGALRSTIGIFSNGGWAEYCQVPGNQTFALAEGVTLRQGVLCEPYSCILRGWENNGLVAPDSEILVMGGGIIGLLWARLFKHYGYKYVTLTEVNERRKKIAEAMDLSYKVYHPVELRKKYSILEAEIHGFDLIVDCTGDANAIEEAFPWLRRGGKLNVFGCCPKLSTMKVNPAEFALREVSMIGTLINPYKFPAAIEVVGAMKDSLDIDKLGIETFELCDYEAAFYALRTGRISKAIFKIGHYKENEQ